MNNVKFMIRDLHLRGVPCMHFAIYFINCIEYLAGHSNNNSYINNNQMLYRPTNNTSSPTSYRNANADDEEFVLISSQRM